jgi:AmpD protein
VLTPEIPPRDTDWLAGATRFESPFHDDRPRGVEIDLLVIHNISLPPGEFGGESIRDLFLGQLDPAGHPYFAQIADLRVSAHLLIDRAGTVSQFVPLTARAWHAGESSFCGRERCNDFSIGIELEGTDDLPFTDAQYEQLGRVTARITKLFPGISRDRIVGHSDIAPGRKTDPGPNFDWGRYFTLLDRPQSAI